jgi:hypothetical protein
MPSQRGESDRRRFVLTFNTGRKRFHSIRAEGAERIGGEFTLGVHALIGGDDELGGHVRHWPPTRRTGRATTCSARSMCAKR